ncbi:MAG: hypothetical protein AB1847_00960 [bacterium]
MLIPTSPPALIFGYVTHTYSPYAIISQDDEDTSDDPVIRGEDYQELLTNFPLASQFLTGLFLEVDVLSPGGNRETYERSLVDRIGFDVRQNGGTPNLNIDASGPPVINELDLMTIILSPGLEDSGLYENRYTIFQQHIAEADQLQINRNLNLNSPEDRNVLNTRINFFRKGIILRNSFLAAYFINESDSNLEQLQQRYLVRAYYNSPRIIICGNNLIGEDSNSVSCKRFIDIRKANIRALTFPGQVKIASFIFNGVRGFNDSILETLVLQQFTPNGQIVSAHTIIKEAAAQQIPLMAVFNSAQIDSLDISLEAKARIAKALTTGKMVIVPSKSVMINNELSSAWYEVKEDGEVIAVTEDGGHQGIEYSLIIRTALLSGGAGFFLGFVSGFVVGALLQTFRYSAPHWDKEEQNGELTAIQWALGGGVGIGGGLLFSYLYELGQLLSEASTIFTTKPAPISPQSVGIFTFFFGFGIGFALALQIWKAPDPPVPDILVGLPECEIFPPGAEPGVTVKIVSDELFALSFNKTLIPTAFRAKIYNQGPEEDTFDLTFLDIPPGFEIVSSLPKLTVPSGGVVETGIYLRPMDEIGQPGSLAPFSVNVASINDPAITATDSKDFIIPEVHGVDIFNDLLVLNTSPGSSASTKLTLTAVGNVPEEINLNIQLSEGISVSGIISPVSLNAGDSVIQTLTFIPTADTPLNTILQVTITATYGPPSEPLAATSQLQIQVTAPGALPASNASNAAAQMGRPELSYTLSSLGSTLTELYQVPGSEVYKSRTLALLETLAGQLDDPLLAPFAADFTTARAAIAASIPGTLPDALDNLNSVLTPFQTVLSSLADHNFEVALRPNNAVALPLTPTDFELFLYNTGTETTTYNLSLSALPPSVTGSLNRTTVTLAPGEVIPSTGGPNVIATLTQSAEELLAFDFGVTVSVEGASEITRTAQGAFTARKELVRILSVTADPSFTDPGGQITISARLLNAVNQNRRVLVYYTVKDPTDTVVFTSTPQEMELTVLSSLDTAHLQPPLDTTGFGAGSYTLEAVATDLAGHPIPGAVGQGTLLIGSPPSCFHRLVSGGSAAR